MGRAQNTIHSRLCKGVRPRLSCLHWAAGTRGGLGQGSNPTKNHRAFDWLDDFLTLWIFCDASSNVGRIGNPTYAVPPDVLIYHGDSQ